jgi:hypothetical protein
MLNSPFSNESKMILPGGVPPVGGAEGVSAAVVAGTTVASTVVVAAIVAVTVAAGV